MKKLDWQTIKQFGQVKYFNISYVAILSVPLIKEIIAKLNLKLGKEEYFLPDTVVLLYLASLCYALGIAIYQFFCPKLIKSYDKEQDYIRDNYDIYLKAYPDLKLQIVRTNLKDVQKETRDKIEQLVKSELSASKTELETLVDLVFPSCIQHYLTSEYETLVNKYKLLIWLSFLFYCRHWSHRIFIVSEKLYCFF